jgi:hypothetical protein
MSTLLPRRFKKINFAFLSSLKWWEIVEGASSILVAISFWQRSTWSLLFEHTFPDWR